MESKDEVTASAVALGVPEIEVEMSREIDRHFFVLSVRDAAPYVHLHS